MVRPKIYRRISKKPEYHCLNPEHNEELSNKTPKTISMNLDEFEAIRLGDYHNLKQKQSAELMGISQPTFHRILNSARKKTATSLIEGIEIEINNENFINEDKVYLCEDCGFQWTNPKKTYTNCPDCESNNIKTITNHGHDDGTILNNKNTNNAENLNFEDENETIVIEDLNCQNDENTIPLNKRKSYGGGGSGKGPSKSCVCPNCGHKSPKIKGFPCKNMKCPECGTPLCGSKKI